jgi:hypothetical protein
MIRWSCQRLHGCAPVAPSDRSRPRASPSHLGRRLGEALATAGADLDLGCDQLADEMRLELGRLRRGVHLLEPVDERERLGIEEGELLLDRDGEVGAAVVGRAGVRQQLLVGDPLLVAHCAPEPTPQ